MIDGLEGDSFMVAVHCLKHLWRKCIVPFGIDNSSFQGSLRKGRSSVTRLNEIVREAFAEMVHGEFIIDSFWISSEDNELADDLSRERELHALRRAFETGFWGPGVMVKYSARHLLACRFR